MKIKIKRKVYEWGNNMKIDEYTRQIAYQTSYSDYNKNRIDNENGKSIKSKTVQKTEDNTKTLLTKKRDSLELSEEGLLAGKTEQSEVKDYDLSKIMELHEKGFHQRLSKEESDYYWNARRNDPELDARLYAQDKAEALKVVGQVQTLLMKVTNGQQLRKKRK